MSPSCEVLWVNIGAFGDVDVFKASVDTLVRDLHDSNGTMVASAALDRRKTEPGGQGEFNGLCARQDAAMCSTAIAAVEASARP